MIISKLQFSDPSRKTGRRQKTIQNTGALMKEVKTCTTRTVRLASETHSCHVCSGAVNVGHWRGVIHSHGRETVMADNRLENIRRRTVQAKSIMLQNAKIRLASRWSWRRNRGEPGHTRWSREGCRPSNGAGS